MKNIKIIIEYDGTNFKGWQKQPNIRTVQGELEKTISEVTKEEVQIFGSGRTDRGVHANGQVANFKTTSSIPADKFRLVINSRLVNDIVIKESCEVEESFHSRYNAIGKEYKFLIYNNEIKSSLLRNYTYHVPYKLNFEKMKIASKSFIGEHDFKSFMASGSSAKTSVRRIDKLDINKTNDIIEVKIKGNGFLYNMVRIIVGTLIEIGCGKIKEKEILSIINSKQRQNAGHTAMPQGLYLEKVFY